jgi:hypothetical protein
LACSTGDLGSGGPVAPRAVLPRAQQCAVEQDGRDARVFGAMPGLVRRSSPFLAIGVPQAPMRGGRDIMAKPGPLNFNLKNLK